jgi:hypothetical protein
MSSTPEELAERMRLTLDLHEAGVQMMAMNLRREHPEATEAEVAEMLRAWLQHLGPGDLGPGLRVRTRPPRP